ncbi:MAG: hypothetical protein JNK15_18320, partial [Planctomycetes bacterium]|nr:hypothetical protein [Planctomycetota bacterium]
TEFIGQVRHHGFQHLWVQCGGGAASAAGTYEIDKAALKTTMAASMPAEAKGNAEMSKMMDAMVDSMVMKLDLKADGTAAMDMKMEMMGQKMEDSATGTWKLDGTKLTVTSKKKDGKEETKVGEYANGSFTIEDDMGGKKVKMTFKKK